MTNLLKRIFGGSTVTATVEVRPVERDPVMEDVILRNRQKTAAAVVAAGRSSSEIRRRLAGNVLNIVSGDQ